MSGYDPLDSALPSRSGAELRMASTERSPLAAVVGWMMLAAGVSVFAIRLHHAGPYQPPEQGNLRAAVLALGIGILLVTPWSGGLARGAARWMLLAASP